jgi:hypothetical protein
MVFVQLRRMYVVSSMAVPSMSERSHPLVTEEIFGVWDDRALITTDFSQRPSFPVSPGEWVPVPISVDLSVVNAGECNLGVYNMTIFYNDGTPPLVISAGGNPRDPALQFHIESVYVIKNMTLSFGPTIFPGTTSEPLLVRYLTAENGKGLAGGHHYF